MTTNTFSPKKAKMAIEDIRKAVERSIAVAIILVSAVLATIFED